MNVLILTSILTKLISCQVENINWNHWLIITFVYCPLITILLGRWSWNTLWRCIFNHSLVAFLMKTDCWGLIQPFFVYCFLIVLLFICHCYVILLLIDAKVLFFLSTRVWRGTFSQPNFNNFWRSSGLLVIPWECPFLFIVLWTLEERLWTPETLDINISSKSIFHN